MNVTIDGTNEVHYYQRSVEFDGREPETVTGYSFTGKEWVPDYAHARWNHGKPITTIKLSGAVLKKDGTVGAHRVTEEYITPNHRHWDMGSKYSTPAPEWLLGLFADSKHTEPTA